MGARSKITNAQVISIAAAAGADTENATGVTCETFEKAEHSQGKIFNITAHTAAVKPAHNALNEANTVYFNPTSFKNGIICACTASPDQLKTNAVIGIGKFFAADEHPLVTSHKIPSHSLSSSFNGKLLKTSIIAQKTTTHPQIDSIVLSASLTEETNALLCGSSVFFLQSVFSSFVKNLNTTPAQKEEIKRETKSIVPAFLLPSINSPTVFITKAGPAFMQKSIIRLPCALLSLWLFTYSEVIFAPTGKPPTILIKNMHAEQGGKSKRNEHNFFVNFPPSNDILLM